MELWKEIPFINKQSKGPNNFRVNYPRNYFNLFKSITNIDYGITQKKLAREESDKGKVSFSKRGGFHPNLFYGLGYEGHSCYTCKDEEVLPTCLACGDSQEIRCHECIDEDEPGYIQCQEGCDEGRVECDYCEGDGEITCDECDGQGNVDCDYCDEGKAPCEECEGNKKKECETCYGDGEIEDEDNDDEMIECGDCEGTGEIDCEVCDEGAVDCGECGGDGNMECDYCNDGMADCDNCEWGEGYKDCDYCDEGRSECDECSYNGIDREGYVGCGICEENDYREEGDACMVCEDFNEQGGDLNIEKWKWFQGYANPNNKYIKPFIPFKNNLNSEVSPNRISIMNEYINYDLGDYSSLGDTYSHAYNLKKLESWIKYGDEKSANLTYFKGYLRNFKTERKIKVKAHTFPTTQPIDWKGLNFNTLTYMIIPKNWHLDEKGQFKATPIANREGFLIGDFYLLVIQGSKILPILPPFQGSNWFAQDNNYANYVMNFFHFDSDSGKYSVRGNYHVGLHAPNSEYKVWNTVSQEREGLLDGIFRCPGNLITVFKTNVEFSGFAFLNYRMLEPWSFMK
jgi:hypothetical protein